MSRPAPLRYQGGQHLSTKRYRCPTCTRRFATWPAVWAHAESMHGERPLVSECDLRLIEGHGPLSHSAAAPTTLPTSSNPIAGEAP